MEFLSMSEEEQLQRALQECQIRLPPPPNTTAWGNFFLSLYTQIINSEETEKRKYKDKVWDFCVIHSSHASDQEEAKRLANLLTTTLGLAGKTMGDIALGENTLEAASTMVQGSTKVFVLVSKHLEHTRIPKFVFQEALMQQLQRPDWQCKIVPVTLAGPHVRLPFFMANIEGFKLGNDVRTVELVTGAISLEEQMQVRAVRDRDENNFHDRLKRLRSCRLKEIIEVIAGLREEFGDEYDPTEQIPQAIQQLNSLTLDGYNMSGTDQVVNISGCQGVSVGPSFHFHGRQNDASMSSDLFRASSSASSTLSNGAQNTDSSLYFNPSDTPTQCNRSSTLSPPL